MRSEPAMKSQKAASACLQWSHERAHVPPMTSGARITDWRETLDIRARMHAGGWRVVPVCERTKGPLFADWPRFRYDPADPEPPTPRTFNAKGEPTRAKHRGTGAITSGVVAVDIDIDDADRAHAARVAFEHVAGGSPVVRWRPGAARVMLFFAPGEGVADISASIGADPAKVEIFADHAGRQVMVHGRHPSGAVLQYEGDGPESWPLAELPHLDRRTLNAAFGAALEAAAIPRDGGASRGGASLGGVRRQPNADAATAALGVELRRLLGGESMHRASNALADLLAFHIGLDAEQAARILAAVAIAAADLNPPMAERFAQMEAKAFGRARWYARIAETPPDDPDKARFWVSARVAAFKRAWRLLPPEEQAAFLDAALTMRGAA
ncbi:MAG: hypothetical protein EA355_00290 [Rhodobacteraceae bacterium]|nr:MAG: hypothetical protein EA355_00290 [Paracoccaceae bacterium]